MKGIHLGQVDLLEETIESIVDMISDYDVADTYIEDSNNNENQVGEEDLTPTQLLLLKKTRISSVANGRDPKKEAAKHELDVSETSILSRGR